MPTWTVYRKETGELLRHFTGPVGSHFANYAEDEALFDGALDMHRLRIDVETGQPVENVPDRPEPGAQWDEDAWRWVTKGERNRPHIVAINELEAGQGRALREAVLGDKTKLQEIEAAIIQLRNRLE
jgi:hypothetical protein